MATEPDSPGVTDRKLRKKKAVATWHNVPWIAATYCVSADKVRGWIQRGELAAVDVATKGGKRPIWRISPEALAAFVAGRAAGTSRPAPVPQTRRRTGKLTKTYF